MNKLFLSIIFGVLFISLIGTASAAADVAYIIQASQNTKQEFIDSMTELSLTYDIVFANQVSTTNFNDYELILLNDEFFPNWAQIPVNEFPAVLVNGRHMDGWGWTRRISSASQSNPMSVNLNNTEIKGSLADKIKIYTQSDADIYYLDSNDAYSGLTQVASPTFDSKDYVVAYAKEGTVLTRTGKPNTNVNANTVFFGIYESQFWTPESKQLFKNSLLFTLGDSDFTFETQEGTNLISSPVIISQSTSQFLADNPSITSVKTFSTSSGELEDATTITNGVGYFITSSSPTSITFTGPAPRSTQSLSLEDGMNLVGITSLNNIDLDTLPSNVIEVSRSLSGQENYDTATRYSNGWFNPFDLEPGKGYWFKLQGGTVWNYSP